MPRGSGSASLTETDVVALNADGSEIETVTDLNADGSLNSQVITVTSADHTEVTVQRTLGGEVSTDQTKIYEESLR